MTSVDHFAYGYDRNSNRLFKENLLSAGNSELYAYDDLNRLTNMQRGTRRREDRPHRLGHPQPVVGIGRVGQQRHHHH